MSVFPDTDLTDVLCQTKVTVMFDIHVGSTQNATTFFGLLCTCHGAPGHPPAGPRWGRHPSGWWARGSGGQRAAPRATGVSLGPGSHLPSRPCLCHLCLNMNRKECDWKSKVVAYLGDLTFPSVLNLSFSPSLFNYMMTFSSSLAEHRFCFIYYSGCWFSTTRGSGHGYLWGHYSVDHNDHLGSFGFCDFAL